MDPSQNKARVYRIAYAILFLASAAFLLFFLARVVLLSRGNILNNYPSISSDGYDWLTEGLYLKLLLEHTVAARVLPELRPPVFVLVTTLEAFAGQAGYIIAATNAISWGATITCAYRLIDPSSYSELRDDVKYLIAMLMVGLLTVAPINYFRIFLLSDGLCIGAAMASYYFYHRYVAGGKNGSLAMATAIGVLAGTTQTYGLIPPLAASVIGMLALRKTGTIPRLARLSVATGFLMVTTLVLRLLWLGSFGHVFAPKPFDLFQLRFSMADFYLNAWSFYLLPLLPVLAVSLFLARRLWPVLREDLVFLSSATVTAIFAGLSFFYQWPEARFTLLFWPWLVVVAGKLVLGFRRAGLGLPHHQAVVLVSGALLFVQAFFIYPEDYWRPRWSRMANGPRGSWLSIFARTLPFDRLQLTINCGSPGYVCSHAGRAQGLDPYATRTVDFYLALTAENARTSGR